MRIFSRDVTIPSVIVLGLILLLTFEGSQACSGNTCRDCITSGGECAWCADDNFTSIAEERCGLQGSLQSKGCINIQNPKTRELLQYRKDEEVTDGTNKEGTDAIQLQPQKMRIKLRPRGKGHDFYVTFRPANNFPVDLYFLFDLSSTMKEYIKDFAKLANEIADEIGKISKNYRMGYGTFQDKVLLPFTNTHPAKLKNPCPKNNVCAPPFDYRHELSMTRDIANFTQTVDWSTGNTTGNIDRPEGGFDAIMQAIVCKTVGWRDNSRQIILLASDARMHFAGDGKLAGLITPNDGDCHLDDGRTNSMSKIQDYPSVGQISDALERSKKYVIFAVVGKVVEEYRQMVKRVARSSVDALKGGSGSSESNVVDIVRDKYREMTEGVKLEHTASSDNIGVTITPTCKDEKGGSCTNLVIGEKVNPFKVNIRADHCPENPKDRIQHVVIAPSDFLKDNLNVTVEIICDCDCQLLPNETVPSEVCSHGNGTMECGICRCFEGRSGSLCECGQQEQGSAGLQGCSEEGKNSSQGPECSGLGQCVCGVCQCPPDYSGRYCQCNDKVCPVFDGLVCAGNGECQCEECHCNANFSGHACECPDSSETCMDKGEICSGHGKCQCGQCVCDAGYLGDFCQTCFKCGDSVCGDEPYNYRQCALCALPEMSSITCPDDCPEDIILVEQVRMEDSSWGAQREVCRDYQTEECHVRFAVINPGTSNTTLHVQRAKVCTEGPDIVVIVLGVVGGVVGVGLLLLLLFKLLTTLFDRLEYQHFLKELQAPKWAKHKNPIYKEATTTYYNPTMSRD